jgi:hypothetical protein
MLTDGHPEPVWVSHNPQHFYALTCILIFSIRYPLRGRASKNVPYTARKRDVSDDCFVRPFTGQRDGDGTSSPSK